MKSRRFIPFVLIAVGIWAYHDSFTGSFIFDDVPTIPGNPTIRHLWPVSRALRPPHQGGSTVEGRPIVNLSLAINYAVNGTRVWGYHAVNLAIHITAGLVLLGIVRRTLLRPLLRQRFGMAALPLALIIALIWVVHPLQTESVTYIVQRAESMMGLFYLLTIYCVIRGAESDSPGVWYVLSVASCLLGMASKEVMVSAPLIVLLYDRTFLAGSFAQAWRRRWWLYLALAATWIPLGYLVVSTGNRSGSAGVGTGMAWQAYALTQFQAIAHYLRLTVWPRPLIFDYGTALATGVGEVLPGALIVTALLVCTLITIRRWPPVSFLGAWFFVMLAPTSSFLPVATQTMAEHRMYLPLAAVVTLIVIGACEIGRRLFHDRQGVVLGCITAGGVVVLLTLLTMQRNRDYTSEVTIWQDTVEKRPNNARAHNCLGLALLSLGRLEEVRGHYEQAIRIQPDYSEAYNNLGIALMGQGQAQAAVSQWEQALQIKPDFAEVHCNLGKALLQTGKLQPAIEHYQQAVQIKPSLAEAHDGLGIALMAQGNLPEAMEHWEQALRIQPDDAQAHNGLGLALAQQGRLQEAITQYEQALRITRPETTWRVCRRCGRRETWGRPITVNVAPHHLRPLRKGPG